jgi:hypothetical protein
VEVKYFHAKWEGGKSEVDVPEGKRHDIGIYIHLRNGGYIRDDAGPKAADSGATNRSASAFVCGSSNRIFPELTPIVRPG